MRRYSVRILLAVFLGGCVGGLVKEKPPAVYYELDYPSAAIDCSAGFDEGATVRNFTVFSPFDRTEMVVEESDRQVQFSGAHQWVDQPGRMVAEKLVRDMGAGNLFPRVGAAAGNALFPLELTGRIGEFGWERDGKGSRAMLQAEVSLVDTRSRDVLLQRNYRLESRPATADDANAFAGEMSRLVQEFSTRLQQDLCETAIKRQERERKR